MNGRGSAGSRCVSVVKGGERAVLAALAADCNLPFLP